MPTRDLAHEWTDEELKRLERRISRVYREAWDDLEKTVIDYFERFQERDEQIKKLIGTVQNGKEWTEDDYKQWRLNQIARGKRFEALRDKIAERYTKANETAIAYVNDDTPSIYSLNRNYAAYTIEQVAGDVGFTLWDEQTVKRLIVEEPDLMPYYPPEKAVKRGIDLAYGKKQITASVTSSILQGRSIKGIADDLQNRISDMNRTSAVRAARTAVTGAENAGRMDSYRTAEKMGIKLKKTWLATLDGRTRHSHALLDGKTVDIDKPFVSELGSEMMFPGDNKGAKAADLYNCRCTMIADVDGVDTQDAERWARNPETGRPMKVQNMTYEQWAGWKTNTKNGKRVSTAEDLVTYTSGLMREHGVSVGEMSVGNLVEPAKEAVDVINELLNEFRSTMKGFSIQSVKISGEAGATVWPTSTTSVMRISPIALRKNAAVVDALRVGEKKNLTTPVHEFAHTLSSKSMNVDKEFWAEIEKVRKAYRKNLRDIERAEYVTHTMDAASAKKAKEDIFISDYANTNVEEFMAEAFTQAYLSNNPSKYADDVLRIIRRYFRK